MVSIKTVAVLGGTGNLGPSIVGELLSAGFTVTGVSRASSTNSTPTYPDIVNIKKVDYTSYDALLSAFTGQDAVVSVIGTAGVRHQKVAVDAAIAAGVKRFIPSEFGINTRKVRDLPIGEILAGKIAIVDYLQEKAKDSEGKFTWTGITTGLFFDWGLDRSGLGVINLQDKASTVIDSGNEKFQASTLAQIGRAVTKVLQHPDETANKYIATSSFQLSQNELIAAVEELTGQKFPVVKKEKSEDLNKAGEEKLSVGDWRAFVDFLRAYNNADGAGHEVKEEDSANGLIGLEYEDLKEEVGKWLKSAGAL
ncbi:hypothetical protein QBC44DRAFT_275565 [Cladorrhinum sp. PSN332]|nr:hypothetical protein QBC44DRAFT_275565 [Cladorrhinum sp. PSN332]